jgi:RNA polymerase sigma factor (sigma-70 family)
MTTERSDAFLGVVDAHKGILYKIARLYCREADDRDDLMQEMIIQLWKSFDRYDPQYKYSTWIYRICLNVAISFYRKESSRKEISHPLTEAMIHFRGIDPVSDREEEIHQLYDFISALRELDKALMLLYLDEKSYREISEIMGLTETNVATKLNRIKAQLRQKFLNLHS